MPWLWSPASDPRVPVAALPRYLPAASAQPPHSPASVCDPRPEGPRMPVGSSRDVTVLRLGRAQELLESLLAKWLPGLPSPMC